MRHRSFQLLEQVIRLSILPPGGAETPLGWAIQRWGLTIRSAYTRNLSLVTPVKTQPVESRGWTRSLGWALLIYGPFRNDHFIWQKFRCLNVGNVVFHHAYVEIDGETPLHICIAYTQLAVSSGLQLVLLLLLSQLRVLVGLKCERQTPLSVNPYDALHRYDGQQHRLRHLLGEV